MKEEEKVEEKEQNEKRSLDVDKDGKIMRNSRKGTITRKRDGKGGEGGVGGFTLSLRGWTA